jgi:DNA-directed RNA polymerase specialized sigma24 family protein
MVDGKEHYFISFVDAHGDSVSLEVDRKVYEASRNAQRNEARIALSDRRHITRFVLSDSGVGVDIREICVAETPEEVLIQGEVISEIAAVIEALPRLQRKYFLLSRIDGLTFREISLREGRHFTTVHRTIKRAEKKIFEISKKYFE